MSGKPTKPTEAGAKSTGKPETKAPTKPAPKKL